MDDIEIVKIEDDFKTEASCFKIIWYIFLGLIIVGVLCVIPTFPFPDNLYTILLVITGTLALYFRDY